MYEWDDGNVEHIAEHSVLEWESVTHWTIVTTSGFRPIAGDVASWCGRGIADSWQ
jgi:hypothetical protein